MTRGSVFTRSRSFSLLLALLVSLAPLNATFARRPQDPVTGAFTGRVSDAADDKPIPGALVEITNVATGFTHRRKTNAQGEWRQDLLPPGVYEIRVTSTAEYASHTQRKDLYATQANTVIPVPVKLARIGSGLVAQMTPTPTPAQTVAAAGGGQSVAPPQLPSLLLNRSDARRGGNFTTFEISTLPLGSRTLIRTFDDLALLLPGVALPPETLGGIAGPGIGPGIGTAGQFVVNGFSGRTHNFMVDGSDNNDESVGVRRQGYMTPVPQTIESLAQYSVMTLMAPAPFGRNIGAQVNAISRRGELDIHGTAYGFFNSSQFNARNTFDTANGSDLFQLTGGTNQPVFLITRGPSGDSPPEPLRVRNFSGGKESLTLGQFGFSVGGRVPGASRLFYFVAAEQQVLNANEEHSFAVPTVDERGAFRSGATGLVIEDFRTGGPRLSDSQTLSGAGVLSLFPFPNNPAGVYGANTYTRVLPASGKGFVGSARIDSDFNALQREHSVAFRYNATSDERIVPVTGRALFSSIEPRTRTDNFSSYLNSNFSSANSPRPLFNQVRFSFGRTRLNTDPVRDTQHLIRSDRFPNDPYLLNALYLANGTQAQANFAPNTGPINFFSLPTDPQRNTAEAAIGPVGRVVIAGFSPLGIDLENLPQYRRDTTYQIADVFSFPVRERFHFSVGGDVRWVNLRSLVEPGSRPTLVYTGAPNLCFVGLCGEAGLDDRYISPATLAALGTPSAFALTVQSGNVTPDIDLNSTQYNVFGHMELRLRRNLNISLGLRYEYSTPFREADRKIESAFTSDALQTFFPFLAEQVSGRETLYTADQNNFAPRIGLVYAPNLFGSNTTVFRLGYGAYYDQVPGAVLSASRNIIPNFVNVNLAGFTEVALVDGVEVPVLSFLNPLRTVLLPEGFPIVLPGTLNRLNPQVNLIDLVEILNRDFGGLGLTTTIADLFGGTRESRFRFPVGNHFTVGVEQELGRNNVLSAAYVGTFGAYLLEFNTPFGGPNATVIPLGFFDPDEGVPRFAGLVRAPDVAPGLSRSEPFANVLFPGAIFSFNGEDFSRYDSMQLSLRGRYRRGLAYNFAYTLSEAKDEKSDIFDLAGAPALAQCELCASEERSFFGVKYFTRPGEFAPASFDSRHRFAYSFSYELPDLRGSNRFVSAVFGNLLVSSLGEFQTGRPFTVTSVNDVNLDGNLSDRLNTTEGIELTGNGRQPIRLTIPRDQAGTLLAEFGENGAVERNSFRGPNYLNLNLALTKSFNAFGESRILFRTEFFNILNRDNFGIPDRVLESPGFGRAINTITPGRRVQFALKWSF